MLMIPVLHNPERKKNIQKESSAEVSEHSHSAQWGVVVEGDMELTIEGKAEVYRKGDHYFIPAHTKHSAKFLTKCRIIDFFTDKTRYKPK